MYIYTDVYPHLLWRAVSIERRAFLWIVVVSVVRFQKPTFYSFVRWNLHLSLSQIFQRPAE